MRANVGSTPRDTSALQSAMLAALLAFLPAVLVLEMLADATPASSIPLGTVLTGVSLRWPWSQIAPPWHSLHVRRRRLCGHPALSWQAGLALKTAGRSGPPQSSPWTLWHSYAMEDRVAIFGTLSASSSSMVEGAADESASALRRKSYSLTVSSSFWKVV